MYFKALIGPVPGSQERASIERTSPLSGQHASEVTSPLTELTSPLTELTSPLNGQRASEPTSPLNGQCASEPTSPLSGQHAWTDLSFNWTDLPFEWAACLWTDLPLKWAVGLLGEYIWQGGKKTNASRIYLYLFRIRLPDFVQHSYRVPENGN